jgi:hypothetical protein
VWKSLVGFCQQGVSVSFFVLVSDLRSRQLYVCPKVRNGGVNKKFGG